MQRKLEFAADQNKIERTLSLFIKNKHNFRRMAKTQLVKSITLCIDVTESSKTSKHKSVANSYISNTSRPVSNNPKDLRK